ncbi:hypothetical protein Trydic_g12610 [Trypoxylus dichotomus]
MRRKKEVEVRSRRRRKGNTEAEHRKKERKEGQRPDFSLFGAISVSDAVTPLRALHYLQSPLSRNLAENLYLYDLFSLDSRVPTEYTFSNP